MALTEVPQATSPNPSPEASKKRKRPTEVSEELEVDINAPEPPSKKALRKAKKEKASTVSDSPTNTTAQPAKAPQDDPKPVFTPQDPEHTTETSTQHKRSGYGIWIGNLLFTTTKADLRTFLTSSTTITESSITRIHMPTPNDTSSSRQKVKPQNKGFAYVDFSTLEALTEALALSETLLAGRKVLIKDAKSFEGRPEKKDDVAQDPARGKQKSGKPPSQRVFIGNLSFDTGKGDLEEHFSQCGEVADVHVATFEDSGKCKGYAWVTFAEVAAAEAAVKGWVLKNAEDAEEEEEDNQADDGDKDAAKTRKPKRKPKPRKWYVNKLNGRPLRMEFAEDASIRYKKRFGKDATASTRTNGKATEQNIEPDVPDETPATEKAEPKSKPRGMDSYESKRIPKRRDARDIKPGAALAAAPRLVGGIVASEGKKTTFA
ncbi:MAG: hypothetical protein Q9218_002858 [Villophora microphyllina]